MGHLPALKEDKGILYGCIVVVQLALKCAFREHDLALWMKFRFRFVIFETGEIFDRATTYFRLLILSNDCTFMFNLR